MRSLPYDYGRCLNTNCPIRLTCARFMCHNTGPRTGWTMYEHKDCKSFIKHEPKEDT